MDSKARICCFYGWLLNKFSGGSAKNWTNMLETLILEGETKTITSTVQWFWDGSESWKHQLQWCLGDGWVYRKGTNTIYFRSTPLPVTVTTRIITFLVGDPNLNLHLPQASWEGGQPNIYLYPLLPGDIHRFLPLSTTKISDDYLGSSTGMEDTLPKTNCEFTTGLPLKAMDGTGRRADPASFWGKRLTFRGFSG